MYLYKQSIGEEELHSYIFEEEEEEESDDDFDDEGTDADASEDESKDESEDKVENPYKDLTAEELVEELKAKDEKINKIVSDLRNKENKTRSLNSEQTDSKKDDTEDGDENPDPLQLVLEKVETLEKRIANGGVEDPEVVVGEALDAVYDTPWGDIYSPENDINGERFKELKAAYDIIKERYPHRTKEEALKVLKRAHFIANPDAMSDRTLSPAKPNSADAGNLGGSSERGEKGGARYTAEQAELARKFGNDPEVVYKQQ